VSLFHTDLIDGAKKLLTKTATKFLFNSTDPNDPGGPPNPIARTTSCDRGWILYQKFKHH